MRVSTWCLCSVVYALQAPLGQCRMFLKEESRARIMKREQNAKISLRRGIDVDRFQSTPRSLNCDQQGAVASITTSPDQSFGRSLCQCSVLSEVAGREHERTSNGVADTDRLPRAERRCDFVLLPTLFIPYQTRLHISYHRTVISDFHMH